jgi:hypothetical protein
MLTVARMLSEKYRGVYAERVMDDRQVALQLILRGFILGLAIAAPVGPIGVLCTGNSIRSQMSEAIAHARLGETPARATQRRRGTWPITRPGTVPP